MLTRLTKPFRHCAAIALVAVYAVCVLAPVAAFALDDGTRAAHCLTGERNDASANNDAGAGHAHANQADHEHSHDGSQPGTPEKSSAPEKCCGVLCLTALAPDLQSEPAHTLQASTLALPRDNGVTGRQPERLYRPPISLLPL
jgi:hypothetical protein